MKKQLLLFITLILITNCISKKMISPKEDERQYDGKLYFATYNEAKYPRDTINNGPNDSLSLFRNKWYSKHLNSLKEISLFDKKDENLKIVRYTNLGTWSNPFVYKMENQTGQIILTYKQTDGLGGYQTGKIIKEHTKKVNLEKWNNFISKANDINFWNMDTHDPNIVLDGEEWILEILIDGKYHLVTRNNPENNDDSEFAELCNLLIN
ncbi:hypothetical protein IX39_16330 [Chryseobacterium formosense]|uniref:Uncharacterized protein n=1 Tax=Chryseobacterium formosense TaxID=236814 RepID=A0A085Z0L1_9FLAO|nr:hypothetical protein [Chryseobacterium formosense]KFE97974.1 hypothetical protein IX39_16330 [Chryseobacterium formosense]SFT71658.1 hypothetical protein SAMN05421857_2675 [Chryseobacterium formosense]